MPMLIPCGSHMGFNIPYPEWHAHANPIWVPCGQASIHPICQNSYGPHYGIGLHMGKPTSNISHYSHMGPTWACYMGRDQRTFSAKRGGGGGLSTNVRVPVNATRRYPTFRHKPSVPRCKSKNCTHTHTHTKSETN